MVRFLINEEGLSMLKTLLLLLTTQVHLRLHNATMKLNRQRFKEFRLIWDPFQVRVVVYVRESVCKCVMQIISINEPRLNEIVWSCPHAYLCVCCVLCLETTSAAVHAWVQVIATSKGSDDKFHAAPGPPIDMNLSGTMTDTMSILEAPVIDIADFIFPASIIKVWASLWFPSYVIIPPRLCMPPQFSWMAWAIHTHFLRGWVLLCVRHLNRYKSFLKIPVPRSSEVGNYIKFWRQAGQSRGSTCRPSWIKATSNRWCKDTCLFYF